MTSKSPTNGLMTSEKLSAYRKRYVYTRAQLAEAMGVCPQTICRWENGQRPIPAWVPKFLELLRRGS